MSAFYEPGLELEVEEMNKIVKVQDSWSLQLSE